MGRIILGGFVVLGATALLLLGGLRAIGEQRAYASFEPVEARDVSLRIDRTVRRRSEGGRRYIYEPTATFRYEVDGETYRSDRLMLHSVDYEIRSWADSVLEPLRERDTITAWYDPENPDRAVLVRMKDPLNHFMLALGGGILGFVVLAWSGSLAPRYRPGRFATAMGELFAGPFTPDPQPSNELIKLVPPHPLSRRLIGAVTGIAIWGAAGITAVVLSAATPGRAAPLAEMGFVIGGFYVLIGGLLFYCLVRTLGRTLRYQDPVLWLTRDHFLMDTPNPLMYEQGLRRPETVDALIVGLKLTIRERVEDEAGEKKQQHRELHRVQQRLVENERVIPGRPIRAEASIELPHGLDPTTPAGTRGNPRYTWTFFSSLRLASGPSYELEFPIQVTDPQSESKVDDADATASADRADA